MLCFACRMEESKHFSHYNDDVNGNAENIFEMNEIEVEECKTGPGKRIRYLYHIR